MFKHTLSLVASATLVASLAADTLSLEPITITSNAIDTNELQAPYASEVYTSKEIQSSHSVNIYEFFNQHTSLITSSGYGNPFAQKLDIHGYGIGDGYQNIVITLNGRRLNNIDMTSQLLGSIPVNTIEKIEILKGAGAVMYGDGANAAVINIITKQGNHNELGFYAGNYHTMGESLYLSSAKDRYSYALHLDHFDADGSRVIDNEGNRDTQKSTNGGIELSYKPTNSLEIHGGTGFTKNDSFYSGAMTLSEYNENPAQKGSAGFPTRQAYRSNVLSGGLIYTFDEGFSFSTDLAREIKQSDYVDYNIKTNYRYEQLNNKIHYEQGDFTAVLGNDNFWGERQGYHTGTKENHALYILGEYRNNVHLFSLGGRGERVTYEFNEIPNVITQSNNLYGIESGYSFMLNETNSLFIHYAHAFQAPDLDRFYTFDLTTYANPFDALINPAKSDTYSLGYNLINKDSKFKASIYYIQLIDEIYAYQDSSIVKNTNIDRSHKYGIDLDYTQKINDQFHLTANYNYVQAIIDTEHQNGEVYDGNKLPGVSNHNIKTTLSYLPNTNTTLALTQLYRSKAYAQEDFANNFTQKQDAYQSTNVSITYAKDNYEMFAKINNLFDQSNGIWINNDEIYPVDFTTTFMAGLKFIF